MIRSLKIILLMLSGIILLFSSCKKENKKITVKPKEIAFTKEGKLQLFKNDSTLITQLDIEIADNDYETETGLMYRTSMKDTQGMLFIFKEEQPRYFYMKNTQIPLDIIYINAAKQIVSFSKNTAPMDETSLTSNEPAKYVLEINAGLADQWGLEAGNYISFNR